MQVTRLSTTPIKGIGLHHPDEIEVLRTGVVGDRRFYLVDDRDSLFSIAKTGALVGLTGHFDADGARLTLWEGGAVVAEGDVEPGDPHTADFFAFKKVDGRRVPGPWDAVLSERAGVDHVDSRRFRMLVEFDGATPHAEDDWRGRRISVGSVVAEVGGPVQRCAGTTRNPQSGEVDLRTLQLIGDYRGRQDSVFGMGFNFGVYATVVTEGCIRVGDELVLLD